MLETYLTTASGVTIWPPVSDEAAPADEPAPRNRRRKHVLRPVEVASRDALAPGRRREGDREVPVGPKARRTREALLAEANRLFAEQGYLETTVAQIAEAAGVSLGTFYQYFRDRRDVVAALVRLGLASWMERNPAAWDVRSGWDGLYQVLLNFVASYSDNVAFAQVWEEVCHVDSELAEWRRDLGRLLTERFARELVAGGQAGHCRVFDEQSADLAARSLTSMVDRTCYVNYVFDVPAGGPPPAERTAETLTDLIAAAIDLRR